MGWKTVVVGSESVVSLSLNKMKIKIDDDYQSIPIQDLNTVIFSHDKCTITIPLLSKLMENNVNVVICDSKNDPIGVFQPFHKHTLAFKQLNQQIQWKITRKKRLWKKIVENKIQTEIDVMMLFNLSLNSIEQLKEYRKNVLSDDTSNREGSSARIYFQTLFGKEFTRDAIIPINFALNYGYKLLASLLSKILVSRGLTTQLGIHHKGETNAFNLTYDFIEPFRAVIDIWVFCNIQDSFTIEHKKELISLLECKVFIDGKFIRLKDGIELIIDSYIGYLNEIHDDIKSIYLIKGIQKDET